MHTCKIKKSIEKAIERISLFLSSYEQSVSIPIAFLTYFLSPGTVPFLFFYRLFLEFLDAVLAFALLIDHPLLFYLHIETFVLVFPLLFHLNEPHNPLLSSY